jgi:hypothetical protein
MARPAAAVAILLVCATFAMAGARQDSGADTSAKPAARSTATTGSKKRKTSAKAATSSSGKSAGGSSKSSKIRAASSKKHSGSGKKSAKARGQQKIDSDRAQEIQEALIREHYLNGEATGTWNQSSEEAMRRFQADQGWQTKQVPDSRALIKLGLGPNKDHLLNPESAMTTGPDAPRASSLPPTSHSADPASTDAPPAASSAPHDSSSPQ